MHLLCIQTPPIGRWRGRIEEQPFVGRGLVCWGNPVEKRGSRL
ncbi:hypothetical protein TPY_0557 [Sulfobacillus acidophilus TPY]|nr:hypothetical protein TPY_0557 [Sulfobacillus acidophilus TPY]